MAGPQDPTRGTESLDDEQFEPAVLHCFRRRNYEAGGLLFAQLMIPFHFGNGYNCISVSRALVRPGELTTAQIMRLVH